MVAWVCHYCPEGHPHQWQATVQSMSSCPNCPFCSGHAVCPHNALDKQAPHTAKAWDTAKNPRSPCDYTSRSSYRACWKCPGCGHEWEARIVDRSKAKYDCPACARAQRVKRLPKVADDARLSLLWDVEGNVHQGLDPNRLRCSSHKLAQFWCANCRRKWCARIKDVHRRTGCPSCHPPGGQQAKQKQSDRLHRVADSTMQVHQS